MDDTTAVATATIHPASGGFGLYRLSEWMDDNETMESLSEDYVTAELPDDLKGLIQGESDVEGWLRLRDADDLDTEDVWMGWVAYRSAGHLEAWVTENDTLPADDEGHRPLVIGIVDQAGELVETFDLNITRAGLQVNSPWQLSNELQGYRMVTPWNGNAGDEALMVCDVVPE